MRKVGDRPTSDPNQNSALKAELFQVEKHRELIRSQRDKESGEGGGNRGYTNAGKSTLLNTMTQAGVLEENQLFATLDPTTRRWIFRANSRFF